VRHVRPELSDRNEFRERLQTGTVGLHEDARDPDAPVGELVERFQPCRGRDRDEDAAVAQCWKRVESGFAADEVEHDVDLTRTLGDVTARVVDGLVHPELRQERVLLHTRRPEHVRTPRLRDLHREMSDSTRRGENEDALTRLNVRGLDQRLPGREPRERDCPRPDVVQGVRDQRELARRRGDVLGVRSGLAREAGHPEDPVSDGEPRHAVAELLDDAGDVPADRERRLSEKAASRTNLPVDRVDPGRHRAYENLRRRGPRPGDLDQLEHPGAAERVLADGAHRRLGAHPGLLPGREHCCIQATVRQEEAPIAAVYTRGLTELREADADAFGGKSANLGELLGAGIPVPPGFALSVDAYRGFVGETGLGGAIASALARAHTDDVDALTAASKAIDEAMRFAPMPDAVRIEVAEGYEELARGTGQVDPPVAVRSSALGEDGADASYAGQQESFLWVRGVEHVFDAVRDCWASLFTPQAISYRLALGSGHEAAMGVTVQAMVDAEISGVLFTCNPVSGDPSMVALNASWGLGIGVVGGELTPDDYLVSKITGEVVRRTVSTKHIEYVPDPAGRGTIRRDVPAERREESCLGDEELAALVEVARRIERHYGRHQDVEWAIARTGGLPESLLVLQARPVTTRPWPAPLQSASALSLVLGMFGARGDTEAGS